MAPATNAKNVSRITPPIVTVSISRVPNVSVGNIGNAVIDEFIGDFKGRLEFGYAIDQIMEAYHVKVFYRSIIGEARSRDWVQPKTTWEKFIAAVPNFFYEDPDLYYFLGVFYYQLEEYDIAKAYLHSVVYNWPDKRQGKHAEAFIEIIESRQGKLQ